MSLNVCTELAERLNHDPIPLFESYNTLLYKHKRDARTPDELLIFHVYKDPKVLINIDFYCFQRAYEDCLNHGLNLTNSLSERWEKWRQAAYGEATSFLENPSDLNLATFLLGDEFKRILQGKPSVSAFQMN